MKAYELVTEKLSQSINGFRIKPKIEQRIANLVMLILTKIINFKQLRKPLLKRLNNILYNNIVKNNTEFPKAVQVKKYEFLSAILHCTVTNLDKGYVSKTAIKKIVNSSLTNMLIRVSESQIAAEKFKEKQGIYPPSFLVLSPTQQCNLKCTGCYASSASDISTKLPFKIVDKIVAESHYTFGNRFMTVSGGEPFMYNDNGRTLFDIWQKYNDMFFLVYTNGTHITKEVAKRLAEVGNVTPAISVEGFEAETDERRGKGIFNRILQSFENLREAGVPFGISVTATKKNLDILLGDEFYDFFFNKQGVSYMWQFQLMPIGRAKDATHLMIAPEERVMLYRKWEQKLKEGFCVADFWNSGVLSNGCIAYGRKGGYIYIDWHGNISPCVFVPYYVDNVLNLYKEGKMLSDALFSDFFKRGREWQDKYGLANKKKPNNWLMPCSIRDHYKNFRENILAKEAKPENQETMEALGSEEYSQLLDGFDKELSELTEKIWEDEYINL